MSTELSRRDFLKGVGAVMGAVGVSGVAGTSVANAQKPKAPRMDANGLTIRQRKYKYPWWVKQVDQITTEIDPSVFGPANPMNYGRTRAMLFSDEQINAKYDKAKAFVKEGLVNNIPGRTLPDLALHYAETAYMGGAGAFDAPRALPVPGELEIRQYNMHPPQSFGLEPWQATPEEASRKLEAAGIQFGAAMVGFTELNPNWLYQNIVIDPSAEDVLQTPDGKFIIPERFKYVVMMLAQVPRDLAVRNLSELGAAGDRAGYSRVFIAANKMHRFLGGLGYGAVQMNAITPVIGPAVGAGLGELGRMNRMINPIFGGNVRIEGWLTDLPLAPDKPIDFGLQEFCKKCKKCATACPAGALSLADEPYWDTVTEFQTPGKKTYFEDNWKCVGYCEDRGSYCSTCLAACPWSKQDKTALHDIAKILSSKTPGAANLLVSLDDAFGYDLVELDSPEMADWWDLDIPENGVDSYQGKE